MRYKGIYWQTNNDIPAEENWQSYPSLNNIFYWIIQYLYTTCRKENDLVIYKFCFIDWFTRYILLKPNMTTLHISKSWLVNKNINFSTSDIVVNEGTILEIFLNKVTRSWISLSQFMRKWNSPYHMTIIQEVN